MARGRNATKQKCWERGRNSGWVSVLFEDKHITTNMQRCMRSTQVTVTWPPFLYGIQLPVPYQTSHQLAPGVPQLVSGTGYSQAGPRAWFFLCRP